MMASMIDPTPAADEVRIIFRPLKAAVPLANRVRSLLKTALRRERLKAVRVEMPPDFPASKEP